MNDPSQSSFIECTVSYPSSGPSLSTTTHSNSLSLAPLLSLVLVLVFLSLVQELNILSFFMFCIVLFPHKINPKKSSYCIYLMVMQLKEYLYS